MFPNKAAMVRRANALLVMLAVAPLVYLVIALLVTFGKPGFAGNPVFISVFFIVLASVSVANIGFTVFTQTSKKLMSAKARYDPAGSIFQVMSLGAVLSEVHAVYGLALTLVAGSIMYGIGFCIRHMGKSLVGPETIHAESRKPSQRVDPIQTGIARSERLWCGRRDLNSRTIFRRSPGSLGWKPTGRPALCPRPG